MTADFCIEAVNEAIVGYGKPAIFNTDQGSQFTSAAFTGLLQENFVDTIIATAGSTFKVSWPDVYVLRD